MATSALLVGALLVVTLLLEGCGTTAPSSSPSRRGGFYQDDGPPDKGQVDPNQVVDAIPRVEPFHPYANRPYSALGRSYKPMTEDKPYRARGLASWYGRQFHGSKTSSGEIYDMFAATAAHTTLPIPSYVRVTNTRTGASLIVRVNDRGPFKSDRVIDLSYAAAVKLGIAAAGTGEVEVVRLTFDDIRAMRGGDAARAPAPPAPVVVAPGVTPAAPATTPPAAAVAAPVTLPGVAPAPAALPPPPAPTTPQIAATTPTTTPPVAAATEAVATGRWAVQVGAFQSQANADAVRDRIAVQMQQAGSELAAQVPPRVERDGSIFRVLVGTLADRAAALALAQQLNGLLGRETFPLMR